jgi:hypothetical protein
MFTVVTSSLDLISGMLGWWLLNLLVSSNDHSLQPQSIPPAAGGRVFALAVAQRVEFSTLGHNSVFDHGCGELVVSGAPRGRGFGAPCRADGGRQWSGGEVLLLG